MEGAFGVKPCDRCGGFSWFRHRDEAVALAPAVSIPAAFAFRLLGVEAGRVRSVVTLAEWDDDDDE